MVKRLLLSIVTVGLAACGAHSNEKYAYRAAPNPNGCYVEVFAQEQFRGSADFVNGPSRFEQFSELRRGPAQQGGIRSVRTGPAATVTVWGQKRYRGSLLRLGPDQQIAQLDTALGGRGESLQVACNQLAGNGWNAAGPASVATAAR